MVDKIWLSDKLMFQTVDVILVILWQLLQIFSSILCYLFLIALFVSFRDKHKQPDQS